MRKRKVGLDHIFWFSVKNSNNKKIQLPSASFFCISALRLMFSKSNLIERGSPSLEGHVDLS